MAGAHETIYSKCYRHDNGTLQTMKNNSINENYKYTNVLHNMRQITMKLYLFDILRYSLSTRE